MTGVGAAREKTGAGRFSDPPPLRILSAEARLGPGVAACYMLPDVAVVSLAAITESLTAIIESRAALNS